MTAQLLLEPADMHRDSRLGFVHPLCGTGETACVDNGDEGAQLIRIKHD
jgi:hypothetical protein